MDYRYLKAFYLAAKHGNVTRAASELHIAQSAVSRQIRLLEASLDAQLLLRTPTGVLLTTAGQQLFQQVMAFQTWSDEFEGKKAPTVRIATMEGVASYWLPERLARIDGMGFDLDITVGTAEQVRTLIEASQVDLALTPEKIDTALVSTKKLFREELVLICSKPVKAEDVAKHAWVYVDRGSYLARLTKQKPPRHIRAGSVAAMLSFVRLGHGIAVVPRHLLTGEDLYVCELPQLRDTWIHLASLNYEIVPTAIAEVRRVLTGD